MTSAPIHLQQGIFETRSTHKSETRSKYNGNKHIVQSLDHTTPAVAYKLYAVLAAVRQLLSLVFSLTSLGIIIFCAEIVRPMSQKFVLQRDGWVTITALHAKAETECVLCVEMFIW